MVGSVEDFTATTEAEMKIPFNSRDDIVWRGQLAAKWLQANSNVVGHFGDVDLTFEVVEY